MELQIFYAASDSGMYRAPPSDKADELSKSSYWKYIFCSSALKNVKMHKTVTHRFPSYVVKEMYMQRWVAITKYIYSMQERYL